MFKYLLYRMTLQSIFSLRFETLVVIWNLHFNDLLALRLCLFGQGIHIAHKFIPCFLLHRHDFSASCMRYRLCYAGYIRGCFGLIFACLKEIGRHFFVDSVLAYWVFFLNTENCSVLFGQEWRVLLINVYFAILLFAKHNLLLIWASAYLLVWLSLVQVVAYDFHLL